MTLYHHIMWVMYKNGRECLVEVARPLAHPHTTTSVKEHVQSLPHACRLHGRRVGGARVVQTVKGPEGQPTHVVDVGKHVLGNETVRIIKPHLQDG